MLTKTLVSVGTMLAASATFAQTPGAFSDQMVSAPTGPTEFLTQDKAGQWRASKLRGVEVYGDNHQRVGEIRDILLDHNGKIDAVVIGVGGFLGFHEHDVGLRFDQLFWAEPGNRDETDVPLAYPDHATVKMTKDQLLAFPRFHYAR